MICKKCSANVPEGASFCPSCGADLREGVPAEPAAPAQPAAAPAEPAAPAQPAAAPAEPAAPAQPTAVPVQLAAQAQYAAPVQPVDFTGNLKGVFHAFFSKTPFVSLEEAANDKSYFWVIIVAAAALLNGLMLIAGISPLIASIIGGTIGNVSASYISRSLNYGMIFGCGVLTSLIASAAVIAGMLIFLIIAKKEHNFNQVANTAITAMLPVICTVAANIVIGLVLPQLAAIAFAVSLPLAVIMIYTALQKFAKTETVSFWGFALMLLAVAAVISLFVFPLFFRCVLISVSGLY